MPVEPIVFHWEFLPAFPLDLSAKSAYSVECMAMSGVINKRLLWTVALVLALCAAFSFTLEKTSADYIVLSTGTNVSRVSFKVTHGTNHVYYQPSRIRWEADQLWKRFGFRGSHEIQRKRVHTFQPGDVLWVTCAHGVLPTSKDFKAVLVRNNGRQRHQTSTGALCDAKRGVSLSAWIVFGGVASNHASTLRIIDTSRGVDLVTIKVR